MAKIFDLVTETTFNGRQDTVYENLKRLRTVSLLDNRPVTVNDYACALGIEPQNYGDSYGWSDLQNLDFHMIATRDDGGNIIYYLGPTIYQHKL